MYLLKCSYNRAARGPDPNTCSSVLSLLVSSSQLLFGFVLSQEIFLQNHQHISCFSTVTSYLTQKHSFSSDNSKKMTVKPTDYNLEMLLTEVLNCKYNLINFVHFERNFLHLVKQKGEEISHIYSSFTLFQKGRVKTCQSPPRHGLNSQFRSCSQIGAFLLRNVSYSAPLEV